MLEFPFIPDVKLYQTLLRKVELYSQVLLHIPLDPVIQTQIFHQQLLKSSLFSARIEGNLLTLAAARNIVLDSPKEKSKREISNVLKALHEIKTMKDEFDVRALLRLHSVVMNQLTSRPGKLRTESSAIYDQFSTIVYLTPEPGEMKKMLDSLIEKINSKQSEWQLQLPLIAVGHYYFEKIHPFLDGNGRTGRVLLQYQLHKTGLVDGYVLPLDQYFDAHRSEYYDHLEKNTRHVEAWIEFFLEGMVWSLQALLQDIKNSTEDFSNDSTRMVTYQKVWQLLPRRKEIYHVIKDHPGISFANIARRFPTISKRTLAYDVQQLVKEELVTKHGLTRGVVYSVIEPN